MKTYEEMVQFTVDEAVSGDLRYHEWAVVIALAHAYGIDRQTVFKDIVFEKEVRAKQHKEAKRAESRASNEARRLANLANKELA